MRARAAPLRVAARTERARASLPIFARRAQLALVVSVLHEADRARLDEAVDDRRLLLRDRRRRKRRHRERQRTRADGTRHAPMSALSHTATQLRWRNKERHRETRVHEKSRFLRPPYLQAAKI